jgi:tRNA pseudouridine13 synthase
MKLRCRPEDFVVEELPTVEPATHGPFTLYRLTKTGLGTLEAVEAIRHRWQIDGSRISYGGLKDRHAVTTQLLTIRGGPRRALHQTHLTLEPLGYLDRPYTPAQFRGNRFVIVLRDLTEEAAARAEAAMSDLRTTGLPNYFDDQRFGSVGYGGQFIAESWLKGDHETALRLALAEPNPHDRPGTREEKAVLREFWGRWAEAKERLPRSHARSLVTYLVDHPTDFRGAFARLNKNLRTLYFSAYQSFLWNAVTARWIEANTRPEQRIAVTFRLGDQPLPTGLTSEDRARLDVPIPLPASRSTLPGPPVGLICEEVVAARGLEWNALRVKHLKDVFFSKGNRPALFDPGELTWEVGPDELYPKRRALTLRCTLPKGSYATMLVKRLTAGEPGSADAGDGDDEAGAADDS